MKAIKIRNILKTMAIAFFIAIMTSANAQTWTQIGSMVVGADTVLGSQTRAIKGFGSDVYACTELGLFKSTNNGDSWNNITSGNSTILNEKLTSILVAANGNIFLGSDNKLFKSIDGGNTWSAFSNLPGSTKFWDIAEINGNIVVSCSTAVYYSSDYGNTWNTSTGISSQVRYFLVDSSNLFLGGTANGVYKSTDNGQTWTTGTGFPATPGIWNVEKQGSKLFASSVGGKGLFSSSDNGTTWESTATSYFGDAYCQIFGMKTNSSAFVVSHSGSSTIGCNIAFRISTDNGNTWTPFETGLNTASHYYPNLGSNADGSLMFTIRNNGTEVYRFGTASMSTNNLSISTSPISIYPNPANSILNIEVKETTNIKIVNMLGETVSTQKLNAGNNSIDISSLTKGIYFIQPSNGGAVKFIKE